AIFDKISSGNRLGDFKLSVLNIIFAFGFVWLHLKDTFFEDKQPQNPAYLDGVYFFKTFLDSLLLCYYNS
ncbi:hypothetical protein, partial [Myroides marinus]|uniref:hypothetical protein n=1 Tax=Myroides marinus TaxID=703342 RepID=UPI002578CCFE